MSREEAIEIFKRLKENAPNEMHLEVVESAEELFDMAIQALSQEPCDDVISREAVNTLVDELARAISDERCHIPQRGRDTGHIMHDILDLPSVTQKSGKCKNCKYFEYDSMAKVDGVPLIVAHEICNKWGDGCKTNEDGYCFLFEPQEKRCEDCNHYGKLSLDCARCDDDCSMYEPQESEKDACKDCYYNDGEVHAECVICDKAESEE